MSIAQRSIRSSMYTMIASGINTLVSFFRSILLARLIVPELFGVYAFATSFVLITASIPIFGMASALLHHSPESEDEDAPRVHFTVTLAFNLIWAFTIAIVAIFAFPRQYLWLLWIFLATQFVDNLVVTSRTILIRNVIFKRIAIIDTVNVLLPTISALLFAWKGYGIIGLISTDVISAIIFVFGYLVIRPPWKIQLGWSPKIVRYFLRFGYRTLLGDLVGQAVDNIDNLWTGHFLGTVPLGFYSRAYTFALYPRKVIGNPINSVASGTYAELKDQKKQLSQAFFRVNALLIRSGFLMAGLLTLIAPEFINLMIGKEWLPMLTAFRLMLLFTLLDPIRFSITNLFIAVGKPEKVLWARLVQLCVLVIGLFFFGNLWNISGVAVAVNLMILTGITIMLWQARTYVNFSIPRLFGAPTLALIIGIAFGRLAVTLPGILGSYWRTGFVKAVVFCLIYALVIILLEHKELPTLINYIKILLPKRETPPQAMADMEK